MSKEEERKINKRSCHGRVCRLPDLYRRYRLMVLTVLLMAVSLLSTACNISQPVETPQAEKGRVESNGLPVYEGEAYAVLNDNRPLFTEEEYVTEAFEEYSPLDDRGRCGPAAACLGRELMPEEKRGRIGQVKPSGWKMVKYDIVEGKYLYNRCHLIAYQLTGENANDKNLITGTRYMNVEGMLPFENQVAQYIEETGNHVLYRVTPVFEGENLLASGVKMEACSVEDEGEGICFYVYCFNIQPGVEISYADGESRLAGEQEADEKNSVDYVLNTNTKKFHYPECSSVDETKEQNKEEYSGSRDALIDRGYSPCGNCRP